MNHFLADGKKPLSSSQLDELLTDHSLHLAAIDLDATIQYKADGRFTATTLQGENDKGKWSISSNGELCMKFDRWYFGDLKCYTLFEDNDAFIFFTSNGARCYTGTRLARNNEATNDQPLNRADSDIAESEGNTFPTQLSNEEKAHTLQIVAKNCPACNLTGVNLRGAQLIAANLAGANLSGADLREANLRRANLIGANLTGARLNRTNLAGADLTNCDLTNADLSGSNLIRATVTGALLKGAQFTGAHLESIQGFKE